MSYEEWTKKMQVQAQQAEQMHAKLAPQYARLVDILAANETSAETEKALWGEYERTSHPFYRQKVWDLQRERPAHRPRKALGENGEREEF